MKKLRGLKSLVHDAVDATTYLVREGHESVARSALRVVHILGAEGRASEQINLARRVGTDGILATVRGVNRLVAALSDAALDAALDPDDPNAGATLPMRSDVIGAKPWLADGAIGVLNGIVGDHLASSGNALDMQLWARLGDMYWRAGQPLPVEPSAASPDLVVLVHGLTATEWSWCLSAEERWGDAGAHFGGLLARDLGVTPVYIRYNTGRSVQTNGRELAALLDALVAAWPVPARSIALVGHSMGGLVSRSACHEADQLKLPWLDKLKLVASLGTPHQGAPLAVFGDLVTRGLGGVDLPATRIISAILARRSAGIHDLATGDLEADVGRDPDATASPERRVVPLLDHVRYAFFAATITQDTAHPVGELLGDLLVRIESASGPRVESSTFPIHTASLGGLAHQQIQIAPAVYAQLATLIAAMIPSDPKP